MGILSKKLVKSLAPLRYAGNSTKLCSFNRSLLIPRHHLQPYNNLKNNNNKLNLLVKRFQGNTFNINSCYFSALSSQNFSVKHNIYLPFALLGGFPEIAGTCNGLLCLCDPDGCTALWNPSTKVFKLLPQSSVQRPPSAASNFNYCSGLGFDSKSQDYKVVRFIANFFEENGTLCPEANPFPSTAYVNGVYYWIAFGKYVDDDDIIISFDFANEKFSTLPIPEFDKPLGPNVFSLLEYNGSLGAIFYPFEGTEKSFELWVMNGSWTKEFVVESVSGVVKPLGFWENGELFFEGSNQELLLFDPATRKFKNLGIYDRPDAMEIIPYVESSVPINGRSELEKHLIYQPAGDHGGDIENKEV
ncbi:hypothetical protein PTKIN_Ptkin17bG0029000 [Pterospermum kingtungense]